MRSVLVTTALWALSAAAAAGQDSPDRDAPHAIVARPEQVAWRAAPPVLPPGARLAVLEGDPARPGPFTMRIRLPDGYRIPPHYHPTVEHVTVLEGTFKVGMGQAFDSTALQPLPAGTFAALAPGVRHFAQAEGATVLQLHGIGPWQLIYVDPDDDPRRTTP
ncbi:MAG TPA: cupin domain-containing protein [Gemmatimonadales bacterium]|nr:cupin domain-containing protein [Gemmatimonadales bacterium]